MAWITASSDTSGLEASSLPPPRVLATTDPDEMTELVQPYASNSRVIGLARSGFDARLTVYRSLRLSIMEIALRGARVVNPPQRGYQSVTVARSGAFDVVQSRRVRHFGTGSAYLLDNHDAFDFRIGGAGRVLVANFDRTLFESEGARSGAGARSPSSQVFVGAGAGASFVRLLDFFWREARHPGGLVSNPRVAAELENALARALTCATLEQEDDGAGTVRVPPRALAAAEDALLARLRDPISLGELARIADTSVRTLTRSFRAKHGTGPIAFLRARRLEAAYQDLLRADPAHTTVADVCARYGFANAGRFAAAFRSRFGEAPSAILQRH